MWNFSIVKALGLLIRTAPFLIFRAAVYAGITAALVAASGVGAGAGYGLGLLGSEEFRATSTMWGAFAGFGLTAGVIFLRRDNLLYLVKAGLIAALVECLDRRPLPYGLGQVAHVRKVLAERFGQTSALFALDRLIRGVIAVISGLVAGRATILPIPGLGRVPGAVRACLRLSAGLVDAVVLAHAIRTRSENAWEAAHDGLVLHAQNARTLLVHAVWLTLVSWGLAGVVFLLMLAPAAALVGVLPGGGSAAMVGFALLFAWAMKAAVIEPFALACMMQVFRRVTEGQEPQPEWRGRLTQVSDRFRQLGETAVGWRPEPAAEP